MKFRNLFKAAVAAALLAVPAQASSIYLAGDSNIFTTMEDNEVFFQNVFNGMSVVNYAANSLAGLGTTATETYLGSGETITEAGLGSNDFMIFGYSRTSVTDVELSAISAFYDNGGSLFLYGEGNSSFTALNTAVNAILSAVGSSMSLSTTNNLDQGGGLGIQPLEDLVTTGDETVGVNSWYTAYASFINVGDGTALISGTGNGGVSGAAIAFEGGDIAPVPVPATLPLIASGFGLIGVLRLGRKRCD